MCERERYLTFRLMSHPCFFFKGLGEGAMAAIVGYLSRENDEDEMNETWRKEI